MDAKSVIDMAPGRIAGRGAASGHAVVACLAVIGRVDGAEVSVEEIAGGMGCSRSTAARAIKALVMQGRVRVEMGSHGVTGPRRYIVEGEGIGRRGTALRRATMQG